jgi:hypothetical protein
MTVTSYKSKAQRNQAIRLSNVVSRRKLRLENDRGDRLTAYSGKGNTPFTYMTVQGKKHKVSSAAIDHLGFTTIRKSELTLSFGQ